MKKVCLILIHRQDKRVTKTCHWVDSSKDGGGIDYYSLNTS